VQKFTTELDDAVNDAITTLSRPFVYRSLIDYALVPCLTLGVWSIVTRGNGCFKADLTRWIYGGLSMISFCPRCIRPTETRETRGQALLALLPSGHDICSGLHVHISL
jgi:hypothetical protein